MEKTVEERVNDVYVTSNVAGEIVLISKIGVSERLHQLILTVCVKELKNIQKHIRLVSEFTTTKDENQAVSILVMRVPEKHNSIEGVIVLSKIVQMIHECILDNIEKDLKPFYDE